MCNAFSFIVTKAGKVFWKCGMDTHEAIITHFKLKDDKTDPVFVRCEIAPKEKIGYLHPKDGEWIFRFDNKEGNAPDWWKKKHELASYSALDDWKKEVYSKIDLEQACNPITPFKIKAPKITEAHKKLLKQWVSVGDSVWVSVGDSVRGSVGGSVWVSVWDSVWVSVWDSVRGSVRGSVGDSVWVSVGDSVRGSVGGSVWVSVGDSVRDSVWDSVRGSVWDSVGDSVRDSVWDSVRGSVWDSVGDSVRGYIGSMFKLKRKDWKYTKKIKTKGYPFQPAVTLWKQGLVAGFDGKKWGLYGSKKGDGKCEKLYEMPIKQGDKK